MTTSLSTVGVGVVTRVPVIAPDIVAAMTAAVDRFRPAGNARLLAVAGTDIADGEVTELDGIVTRRRVESDSARIHQDVRATAADGSVVYTIRLQWSVADTDPGHVGIADVGSVEWGKQLAARLSKDDGFVSSVSTFDGTIGIVSGDEQVRFRIYRGQIVETARKSLDGPTFDITADERTWVELLLGEYDDYVRLAARGRFRILGSGFQYLRMTRTVRLMVTAARAMAAEHMAGEHDADQR
ncbi:MAG TPA: hypothetical protein VGL80_18195 [Pseudonocardiaceae bacterium]|jgi:hypothetical protein